MGSDWVLGEVGLWGKGMVWGLKGRGGVNGYVRNEKWICVYVGRSWGMELGI